jgi:HlyD family secretion protein
MHYYFSLAVILAGSLLLSCRTQDGAFDATGTFEATEVTVSAEATGRIMEFSLREGSRLEAGAYAGYIDSTQLYLRKRQLMAGLRAVDIRKPDIRKQIAVLEQQMATARAEQQRMENLVEAGAGNQKQLDDMLSHIRLLQAQIDAQRSSLDKTSGSTEAEAEALLYQIMQLDDQLQKCRITNPLTGLVLARYAEAGEVTVPGKPLYKIADTDLLHLRAYITAAQLSRLQLGQSVRVYADYGESGRREYPGVLTWISEKSEFTPKGIQTRDERSGTVYAVKIAVRNDGYLKIGQYGEATFKQPEHP